MPIRPPFSVFDSRIRSNDDRQWVACPVYPCRYEVPADLEDVARERHRSAHTAEEWAGVGEMLQEQKASMREHYERDAENIDADLRRLNLWAGQDT